MALSLIEDAERAVQGHAMVPQDPGLFERYRAFRTAHTRGVDIARDVVDSATNRFRGTQPLFYINILPVKAWLETKTEGHYSKETEEGLNLPSTYDLDG